MNNKNIKKFLMIFFCFILVVSVISISAKAMEICGVPVRDEITVPDNLNLSLNETYIEHEFLKQVTANYTGEYALLFCNYEAEGEIKPFTHFYVQLFDSQRNFVCEISFFSKESLTIEYVDSKLNIYFCKMIVVFDITNQEFTCYETDEWAASENGKGSELRKTKFISGKWEYSYKKGFIGFVELNRTNGLEKQILFKTDLNKTVLFENILPALAKGIVVLLLVVAVIIIAIKCRNRAKRIH